MARSENSMLAHSGSFKTHYERRLLKGKVTYIVYDDLLELSALIQIPLNPSRLSFAKGQVLRIVGVDLFVLEEVEAKYYEEQLVIFHQE
jgi:hypothetical protein